MDNQPLESTGKSKKKKILIWAAIAIASIWLWYLTITGLLIYGVYKLLLKRFPQIGKTKTGLIASGAVLGTLFILGLTLQIGPEPTLAITEPGDKTLTEAQQITIKGSYEPADLTVTMNGKEILTANGAFETTYALQTGENKISFEAKNWQKTTTQELTITREETATEKEAQLKAEAEQSARLSEEQAEEDAKKNAEAEEEARKKAEADETNDGPAAAVCAQNYVKDSLKAPSTAKFPWLSVDITPLGKNQYRISSYVDAQNSFGAMIRTNYTCTVTVISRENYQCLSECDLQ